jgi:four helix bundle protein
MTLAVYRSSGSFPKNERYGLTSQIRRCSSSIAASIAEGCGRRGNGDFYQFLQMAAGSASELDYHLLLVNELGYLQTETYQELYASLVELRRMLSALIVKVSADRGKRFKRNANC